jgi:hypothetical protein
MSTKVYVVDIDGTICTKTDGDMDYRAATPFLERIHKVNELYDQGHTIIYFTARGMGRSKNNPSVAYEECYTITKHQLEVWGAKHHRLVMGKPYADVYLDDKGVNDKDFFQ